MGTDGHGLNRSAAVVEDPAAARGNFVNAATGAMHTPRSVRVWFISVDPCPSVVGKSNLRPRLQRVLQGVQRNLPFRARYREPRWANAFVAGLSLLLHEFDELHELDDRVHS